MVRDVACVVARANPVDGICKVAEVSETACIGWCNVERMRCDELVDAEVRIDPVRIERMRSSVLEPRWQRKSVAMIAGDSVGGVHIWTRLVRRRSAYAAFKSAKIARRLIHSGTTNSDWRIFPFPP